MTYIVGLAYQFPFVHDIDDLAFIGMKFHELVIRSIPCLEALHSFRSSLSLKLRWDASSWLLIVLYRMESSANSQDDKLFLCSPVNCRGLFCSYMVQYSTVPCRSRIAPRTLSRGTPDYTVAVFNLPFPRTTCCVRSDPVVEITLYSINVFVHESLMAHLVKFLRQSNLNKMNRSIFLLILQNTWKVSKLRLGLNIRVDFCRNFLLCMISSLILSHALSNCIMEN